MRKTNIEIRSCIAGYGLCQRDIADMLGITAPALSEKLRKELPEDEKKSLIDRINKAVAGGAV